MNLKDERVKYRTAGQRLRRARRLYVFLNRHHINVRRDPHLDYMEKRMHEGGLFALGTDARHVRQSILTYLFRFESNMHGRDLHPGWYEWLMQQAWDICKGYSKPIMEQTG